MILRMTEALRWVSLPRLHAAVRIVLRLSQQDVGAHGFGAGRGASRSGEPIPHRAVVGARLEAGAAYHFDAGVRDRARRVVRLPHPDAARARTGTGPLRVV